VQRRQLQDDLRREKLLALLTAEDRQTLLVFELLIAGEYRRREDLAARLSASPATLSRDLQAAQAGLREHALRLERKPHVGVRVAGRESAIRNRLLALILETGLEPALLNMCLWGEARSRLNGTSRFPVQEHILREAAGWDLPGAWRWINLLGRKLGADFSESAHLHLALHWAIMVRRIQAGHPLEAAQEDMERLRERREHRIVEALARQFLGETGALIPAGDLARLTLEVLTTPAEDAAPRPGEAPGEEPGADMVELAQLLVQGASERLGRAWVREDVRARLALHLQRSALRLRHGLPVRNPLTSQILATFPQLWKATREALLDLRERTFEPLPPDEIANLTVYLALGFGLSDRKEPRLKPRIVVTCPKGGVAVWMLLSRIREELPEVEVVDVVPVSRLGRFDFSSIDAVVCTIQLELPGTQVITVSPILPEQDVRLLKQRLGLAGEAPAAHPA